MLLLGQGQGTAPDPLPPQAGHSGLHERWDERMAGIAGKVIWGVVDGGGQDPDQRK